MTRSWTAAAILVVTAATAVTGQASARATVTGQVVLNELNCEGTDWIEVLNPTSAPVDLGGWSLTDDPDPVRDDHVYPFPAGTTVPSGGHHVVAQGAAGFPFGLSCGKDTVRLIDHSGATVDQQALPMVGTTAGTWGRLPDGGSTWTWTTPTSGEPNAPVDPPAQTDDAWLFDPLNVVEIDFDVEQAELDALGADPRSYVDATMTVRDGAHEPVSLPVGLRLKGSGSFRTLAGKAAFKVSLSHQVASQRLEGLRSLTLNNMVHDPSMVAEALTSATMRAAGVAAPRVGYAFVRLNGNTYGVYANVETIDAVFASRWFPSTQHVYENPVPGYDVAPGNVAGFEVDEGSESDRSDLQALVDAANSNPTEWWARMSSVADMDAMLRMIATEHLVGHWDGYYYGANNYYLHSDQTGQFSMIPSGTDETWRAVPHMAESSWPVIFRSCVTVPECRTAYVDQASMAAGTWGGETMATMAQSIADVLRPWQTQDSRQEHTQGAIDTAVAAARVWAEARGSQVQQWLANPEFPAPAPGGSGGGGGAGGGADGGDGVGEFSAMGDQVPVAVGGEGPTPAQAAAEPATAIAPLAFVRGPSIVVPLRPLTKSARTAGRTPVATDRAVRLAVTGLRPGVRHRLAIQVDRRWMPVGSAVAGRSGTARSEPLMFSTPGLFLLRASSTTSSGYVWLRVRGLAAGRSG